MYCPEWIFGCSAAYTARGFLLSESSLNTVVDKNDSMIKQIEGIKNSVGFIILLILGVIGFIIYIGSM